MAAITPKTAMCFRKLIFAGALLLAGVKALHAGGAPPGVRAPEPVPGSILELLDRGSIPNGKAWQVFQSSGYDRGGGFYDSGNFSRIEPGPRYVLLECEGPGVIDRMWFTYKGEFRSEPYNLVVYLDGSPEPVIRENLDDLFSARRPPFVEPLAGLCGDPRIPARYSYVPIGFAHSAKVFLEPLAPTNQYNYRENSRGERIPHVYYQVTYRKLPKGAPVRRFSWQLEPDESEALARWQKRCASAGPSLSPESPATNTAVSVEVEPGATAVLGEFNGGGVLHRLRLQTDHPEALQLVGFWDAMPEPAVSAPLGVIFGCGEAKPKAEVRGLWLGYAENTYYCYLPMPFHRSARLLVRSAATEKIRISGDISVVREPPDPEAFHLHTLRYDHNPPRPGIGYTVLDVQGVGHFAGLVMDRPGDMEGDDQFFVDGEALPSLHGTGTEDFFNFAWGLSHTVALPLHGITQQVGGPVAYRFHLPAGVPFRQSLRIICEHGHDPRRGPNLDQRRYSGVVFYYTRNNQ